MINHGNEIKIFSGNSNKPLAEKIAAKLNTTLGEMEVTHFSDGEIYVRFNETIRGMDVFLIQSTSYPVNVNLMELLIMIDAAKRASAGRITAVIPYFGYARQDRKARSREPITANSWLTLSQARVRTGPYNGLALRTDSGLLRYSFGQSRRRTDAL